MTVKNCCDGCLVGFSFLIKYAGINVSHHPPIAREYPKVIDANKSISDARRRALRRGQWLMSEGAGDKRGSYLGEFPVGIEIGTSNRRMLSALNGNTACPCKTSSSLKSCSLKCSIKKGSKTDYSLSLHQRGGCPYQVREEGGRFHIWRTGDRENVSPIPYVRRYTSVLNLAPSTTYLSPPSSREDRKRGFQGPQSLSHFLFSARKKRRRRNVHQDFRPDKVRWPLDRATPLLQNPGGGGTQGALR